MKSLRKGMRFCCLLLTIALASSFGSNAQLKEHSKKNSSEDSLQIIKERLVAFALKAPRYSIAEHQNNITAYQLKGAKNELLNLLTVSANYNDQTFAKQNTTAPVVYPKFYYGISVPLGTLLSRTAVKSAREQVEIGKMTQEAMKRQIRKEVLTKFLQYMAANDQIINLTELIDDETAAAGLVEQRFKDKEITLEQYGTATKSANTNNNQLIQLQLQRDLLRLDIEEMIGVPLEDVLSGKIKP